VARLWVEIRRHSEDRRNLEQERQDTQAAQARLIVSSVEFAAVAGVGGQISYTVTNNSEKKIFYLGLYLAQGKEEDLFSFGPDVLEAGTSITETRPAESLLVKDALVEFMDATGLLWRPRARQSRLVWRLGW
jgi:hypothetical protein